jgi:hypothetical protein
MATTAKTDDWTPAVSLNLDTAASAAFAETMQTFYQWSETQPPVAPLVLQNGWYDITPQMAEDFLRRNSTNRKVSLQTVRKYYQAMKIGEWHRTGQALIINKAGKAEDLQHRCWASYLGRVTFPSYVITDAPVDVDMFAYIDDCKPRSAADALQTSGMNGLSPAIAAAIKLAWRYENKVLTILKQQRIREMSIPEVLHFGRQNASMEEAAHFVLTNHVKAVGAIGNKGVAVFFAWKVTAIYGVTVLEDFLFPLGTGANLAEDSPILALRTRLLKEDEDEAKMNQPRRLALLIKAFNMHLADKKVGNRGLYVRDNEKFPRFEESQSTEMAEAAE